MQRELRAGRLCYNSLESSPSPAPLLITTLSALLLLLLSPISLLSLLS
jgi:hypothetical protein